MAKVTVYSTTYCPYCNMEKAYLRDKGVEFEDILVDREPSEVQNLLDTCGSMGVPCTHIVHEDGGEVRILGFDKDRIDRALALT